MRVRLKIKEIAKKQNMKQYELSNKSGVTAQLLSRYWNNSTRSVSLDQFVRIAKALGVEPGELIEVDEDAEDEDGFAA